MIDLSTFGHSGTCGCRNCQPDTAVRWAFDAAIKSIDVRVDDRFIDEERALAAVLAAAFESVRTRAIRLLFESLTEPVDTRELDNALAVVQLEFRELLTDEQIRDMRKVLFRAMAYGAFDAEGKEHESAEDSIALTVLGDMISPMMVAEASVASGIYYADRYYDRFVLPKIEENIDAVIATAPVTSALPLAALQVAVTNPLTTVAYWGIVANALVSRNYHYGLLKTSQAMGRTGYRWSSVIDARTSAVCAEMNGREFWTADAVNLIERTAATDDPEAAAKMMPWPNLDAVRGASNDTLRDMGFLVPPAHASCRSTLEPVG